MYKNTDLPTFSPTLVTILSLTAAIFVGVEWYLILVVICISLMVPVANTILLKDNQMYIKSLKSYVSKYPFESTQYQNGSG